MKIKSDSILPICGITALAGGILNGLLGTGVGVIFTFLFSLIYAKDEKKEKKDVFASCLISTLPVCLISAFTYAKNDISVLTHTKGFLPGAVLGGLCGAILLDKVKNSFLKKLFAAVIGISGIIMIWKAW